MTGGATVATPSLAGRSATTRRRLTMGDVDAIQVYAPNYFRWMDQGIHELFVGLGHPLGQVLAGGQGMPAVNATCEYLSPVVLDDVLECTTWVARVGTSSFDLAHEFTCEGRTVARGLMTHVWVTIGTDQRPTPVPDWLRAAAGPAAPPDALPAGDEPPASARPGLAYTHCPGCGRVAVPAEAVCVACGAATTAARSGATGVITTWTTVRHAPAGFEAPYVLGWVELDDPALPVMGVVDGGPARLDDLRAGLPVRVSAVDHPSDPARSAVVVEVDR